MSPNGTIIALSIIDSGFNLYDLLTGACVGSFPNESGTTGNCTVPVLFAHGGYALFGGSTSGVSHLWNVNNGLLHQTFAVESESFHRVPNGPTQQLSTFW